MQVIHGYNSHGGLQSSAVMVESNGADWLDAILQLDATNSRKKSKSEPQGIVSNSSSNDKNATKKPVGKTWGSRPERKAASKQKVIGKTKNAPAAKPQRKRRAKRRAAMKNINYKESHIKNG